MINEVIAVLKFNSLILIVGAFLIQPGVAISAISEGKVWYSTSGSPNVTVAIDGTKVTATVWSDIPSVDLQVVNTLLVDEFPNQYVKIQDYNKDGVLDVGIMKGVGYGGSNACYSVYEYDPVAFSYRNDATMTFCKP